MVGSNARGIVGVPRVPGGMVPRAALLQRLGRSPLTVVRAPGGSGKTVLLAQWAAAQSTPGAWVTVEPDVGTRASFWNAVRDAASAAGVIVGGPFDDVADTGVLRRELIRAFGMVDAFVLVVDDAHELRDPLVADDLLTLLRTCPGLVALVGTRTHSDLEAPRLALTLDVTVLEPDALALRLEEVDEIVGTRGSPHGTSAELLAASGGNPLLLRALLSGAGSGERPRASAHVTIGDHLRHLFATRGGELGAFAAVTSIPDDVDVALAAHLSGIAPERVEQLLALLEAEGLVMHREVVGVARYRYHPLVRDVLRERFRRDHQEEYRRASLLASADAESRRQFVPALRHAVDAEDYARASDICLHGGFTLLRSRGAAAILQRVPFRHVARLPFLAIVLGLAANVRGERLKALELLTVALGASRALRGRQRVAERVGLALVETVVLRITGRAEDSATAARRMAKLLDEAAPADLEEIAEQEAAYRYQGALSLFRAGHVAEARLAADRSGISDHALAQGDPESLGAASLVAVVEAARGENTAAAATLARIDAGAHPADLRDGYVGSLAHVARGILALEAGDAEAAERSVDVLRERGNLEHGMLVVAVRAFAALWAGDPDLGLRALDAREGTDRPRARWSAQDRHVVAGARVLLHAALGQTGAAHAALRGFDRSDPVAAVLHAALLLVEQRPDLVVERLTGKTADAGPRLQAAAELLMASASLQSGDGELAEAALRRFLATSAVHGVRSPVVLISADLRPALWDLAERVGADPLLVERLRAMPAPLRLASLRVTLTPREVDVLAELRETASFAEIAATLSVSANTVKTQVRTLYRKLGVTTRDEALRVAYRQGLLGG